MSRNTKAYSLLLFVLAAVIITLLAPRELKFKYIFQKNAPWKYELLTAPYDFPILKTDSLISQERQEIRKNVKPYYNLEPTVGEKMITRFADDFDAVFSQTLSSDYYEYFHSFLQEIFELGIIDEEDVLRLRTQGTLEVNLLESGVHRGRFPITRFFSLTEASRMAIDEAPSNIDKNKLRDMNIGNYLAVNVRYNESTTEKIVRDEMLKIANSIGEVQEGERIVDKGQLVDEYTYQVLSSFKKIYEERSGSSARRFAIVSGLFVIVLLLLLSLWTYLLLFRPQTFDRLKNSIFFLLPIVFFTGITELALHYDLFNIYIIPYAIIPILVRIFFDSRTAFFVYAVAILVSSAFVGFPFEFIVIQTLAGMTAVYSLRILSSRAQLTRTTFLVFLAYVVVNASISLFQNGQFDSADLQMLLFYGINLVFLMFSYVLVYLMERMFGYVSNITFVELCDINSPLLKELSERAPGTFQHSMQMSIIAAEAANKIGADVQLVRAGALYHDIGKMKNPSYFTENQGNINPHDQLSYEESARIIVQHITDGVQLAQKYRLPLAIIDFIRTHHGKGMTKYFYTRYCNDHPEEEVDKAPFSYLGPNPFTKETGILMLADSVEASSRSLSTYSLEAITELVNRIVDAIVADRYMDDTPLTFRDITAIKETFIEKLLTMYHSRIEYPKLNKKEN